MEILLIVLAVVALVAFWVIGVYNTLVQSRNKVKNSWSQIDVQLKRRFDLIPNIVETVKGYAKQEKDIFMQFAEARKMYDKGSQGGNVGEMAQANSMLGQTLGRLAVVVEQYPTLKADQGFLKLQDTLKETEDKISFTRQFYNDVVLSYNNRREVFPSNLVAGMFKFKEAELFKLDDAAERKAVKVSF
ncbi:MAG: LemA family protein [Bacilli bacterium]